jgi:hypothetical protein
VYEQQIVPSGGLQAPRMQYYGQGEGLQSVGDTVMRAANDLQEQQRQREEDDARLWANGAAEQAQLDATGFAIKSQETAPPGADGYTPSVLKQFDDYATQAVANAPTPRAKELLQAHLARTRSSLGMSSMQWEANERVRYRGSLLEQSTDLAAKNVYANPDDAEFRYAKQIDAINQTQGIDERTRQEQREKARKDIAWYAVTGMIDKDPEGALKRLEAQSKYGARPDGTAKQNGWLGPLKLPDGGVATEYSVGITIGGKEVDIPTLVPTLTKAERDLMVNDIIPNEKPIPDSIIEKAAAHARKRIGEGKSPFAEGAESPGGPVRGSMWNMLTADEQAQAKRYAEQKKNEAETTSLASSFVTAANASIAMPVDPNVPIDVAGATSAAETRLAAQGVTLDDKQRLQLREYTERVAANVEMDRRRINQDRAATLNEMVEKNGGDLYAVIATPQGGSLYNSLPLEEQNHVRTYAEMKQSGADVVRNPKAFNELDTKPELLKVTNLGALRGQLTGEDIAYLEKKKESLLNDPQAEQKLMSDDKAIAAVTPSAILDDEDEWGRFKVAVKAAADRELAGTGKTTLGQKRLTEIAVEQAQIVMRKPGFLWGSTPVRRYEIPEAEREKIIEALQRAGYDEPSEAQIRDLYDEQQAAQ